MTLSLCAPQHGREGEIAKFCFRFASLVHCTAHSGRRRNARAAAANPLRFSRLTDDRWISLPKCWSSAVWNRPPYTDRVVDIGRPSLTVSVPPAPSYLAEIGHRRRPKVDIGEMELIVAVEARDGAGEGVRIVKLQRAGSAGGERDGLIDRGAELHRGSTVDLCRPIAGSRYRSRRRRRRLPKGILEIAVDHQSAADGCCRHRQLCSASAANAAIVLRTSAPQNFSGNLPASAHETEETRPGGLATRAMPSGEQVSTPGVRDLGRSTLRFTAVILSGDTTEQIIQRHEPIERADLRRCWRAPTR